MSICRVILVLTALATGALLTSCSTLQTRSGSGAKPQYGSGATTPRASGSTATPAQTTWPYREAPAVPGGHKPVRRVLVVTFASGSGALDTEAEGALALVAEELKLNSKWKVLVVGFADKVGETAAGETLGSKRAQSVSNRLKTIGVPQERLHAQSLGSAYAEGDQWTKGAQKQDRRAEVWAFWE